jgi:hypothetical protein
MSRKLKHPEFVSALGVSLDYLIHGYDDLVFYVDISVTPLPVRDVLGHLVQTHTSTGIPSQSSPCVASNATRQ